MIRPFVLSVSLGILVAGCASPQVKRPAHDLKAAEYKALQENVSSLHAYSTFGRNDPRLFDSKTIDQYPVQFAQLYCKDGTSKADCAKMFDQTVFSKLAELYFAADPGTVNRTCLSEPLICDDLVSLETLFRHLHNSSIEESKREKLHFIDDWRKGKLTDDQLKSALHMDFKFQNGKLVMGIPSA